MPPATGQLPATLGPYRPLRILGAGGMGVVYAATDLLLGRTVAIKLLRPELLASPDALARFQREARLLAALSHPGIATVHSFQQIGSGDHILVMELVEGRSLAERLRDGPLPFPDAARLGAEVAEALAAAHAAGIAHRDLKPANIMLTSSASAKILDFGMAKSIGGATDATDPTMSMGVTTPGAIFGTPAYMAPEQARGQFSDQRSDLFALGCILFECFAGVRVFNGATPADAISQVLVSDPPWHALPPDTPDAVRDLIRRCLAKDAATRTITADEVGKSLRAVIAEPHKHQRAVFITDRKPAGDPAHESAVCGHCGYNVAGAPSFTCPECGRDLRSVGIVRASPLTIPPSIRAAVNAAVGRPINRATIITGTCFTAAVTLGTLLLEITEGSMPLGMLLLSIPFAAVTGAVATFILRRSSAWTVAAVFITLIAFIILLLTMMRGGGLPLGIFLVLVLVVDSVVVGVAWGIDRALSKPRFAAPAPPSIPFPGPPRAHWVKRATIWSVVIAATVSTTIALTALSVLTTWLFSIIVACALVITAIWTAERAVGDRPITARNRRRARLLSTLLCIAAPIAIIASFTTAGGTIGAAMHTFTCTFRAATTAAAPVPLIAGAIRATVLENRKGCTWAEPRIAEMTLESRTTAPINLTFEPDHLQLNWASSPHVHSSMDLGKIGLYVAMTDSHNIDLDHTPELNALELVDQSLRILARSQPAPPDVLAASVAKPLQPPVFDPARTSCSTTLRGGLGIVALMSLPVCLAIIWIGAAILPPPPRGEARSGVGGAP